MNDTSFYLGAYLHIEVTEQSRSVPVSICRNGHRGSTAYCARCGAEIISVMEIKYEFPIWVTEVIGDKWEDVLSEITPRSLHGTGVIIAISNINDAGHWEYLSRYDASEGPREFPTEAEIEALKADLLASCADIIVALRASDVVKSVEARAGYVKAEEF